MAGKVMAQQICLDTSICIELLRENQALVDKVKEFGEATPNIATITVFELLQRTFNVSAAEEFIADAILLNFDEKAARKASDIEKELKHRGIMIGRQDIFIGAIAIVNNCALATLNAKDFSKIKGLKLVKI